MPIGWLSGAVEPLRRELGVRAGSRHGKEFACAMDAVTRYTEAGHELRDLMRANLWGEA